jgi:hypothetical protein
MPEPQVYSPTVSTTLLILIVVFGTLFATRSCAIVQGPNVAAAY